LVNHVLAGTAHVLRDRRAELVLERLYVDAQRAADEARGSGDPGDFGFGCSPAQGEFLYLWCRGTGARTSAAPEVAVPAGLASAALVRAATLETATSWERAEAGIGADAEPVAPGTFARWSGGYADLISVRPAGPRLDRTVIGCWLLAGPGAGPEEEAGRRADERVARLRAEWS
jgi:hypothetical protein